MSGSLSFDDASFKRASVGHVCTGPTKYPRSLFAVPISLPVHDTGTQHCCSISECFHPAFDEHFDNASEVESSHSRSTGDAKTEYSQPISQASESYTPEPEARAQHLP